MPYLTDNIDTIKEAIIYRFTKQASYKLAATKYGLKSDSMLKQFVNTMMNQGAIKDNTGEVVTKSKIIDVFFKNHDTPLHDKEMYATKFKEFVNAYSRPKMGRKRINKTQQSSCVIKKNTKITETNNTTQIATNILNSTTKTKQLKKPLIHAIGTEKIIASVERHEAILKQKLEAVKDKTILKTNKIDTKKNSYKNKELQTETYKNEHRKKLNQSSKSTKNQPKKDLVIEIKNKTKIDTNKIDTISHKTKIDTNKIDTISDIYRSNCAKTIQKKRKKRKQTIHHFSNDASVKKLIIEDESYSKTIPFRKIEIIEENKDIEPKKNISTPIRKKRAVATRKTSLECMRKKFTTSNKKKIRMKIEHKKDGVVNR